MAANTPVGDVEDVFVFPLANLKVSNPGVLVKWRSKCHQHVANLQSRVQPSKRQSLLMLPRWKLLCCVAQGRAGRQGSDCRALERVRELERESGNDQYATAIFICNIGQNDGEGDSDREGQRDGETKRD